MAQPPTCANPLLLEWVKEWWDTARERNSKGVATYKHAYDSLKACPITFGHPSALQQLKGFGPKLCERLTEKLKKHCEENGLPMPSRATAKKRANGLNNLNGDDNDDDEPPPPKKARKAKPYVPAYRTGAYAIVLALSSLDENGPGPAGMSKADLIEEAQPHCDSSFTVPSDPTKFYTAWASMKTLEQKELVYERGRPLKRYALTDEGWEVAKRIRQVAEANSTGSVDAPAPAPAPVVRTGAAAAKATATVSGSVNRESAAGVKRAAAAAISETTGSRRPRVLEPILFDDDDDDYDDVDIDEVALAALAAAATAATTTAATTSTTTAAALPAKPTASQYEGVVADGNDDAAPDDSRLPVYTPIRMAPGSFTVELVLDVREVRAKTDRDYMQEELVKRGVRPIMRSLELGDALWVARCNQPNWLARVGAEGDEVVLDWIVERKRLDDLIGSIKDGRFHEQKFRLRRAGVRNVVYLVEEMAMDAAHFSKYEEAVQSAIASIQVVNGYFLKKTQKMDDSIRYLASMTKLLKKVYEGRPLHVIPTKVLTAKNYLPILKHVRAKDPSATHYISYPAFASLASKSDMMTLRDIYLKMLMCTRGITGEKAVEIQKIWKTPNEFIKAFEQCGSGEEGKRRRINLVSNSLSHLIGRKKIAKVVSQKIAEVWGDA